MISKNFVALRRWLPLLLISSLSLFLELAVIRWLSGEIRLLAYFKNLALLAVFLGLAIGFALVAKGRDYRFSFPALWGLFVVLVVAVGKVSTQKPIFFPGGKDEFLWAVIDTTMLPSIFAFLATVLVFFLISMFLFIPLGQATGEEMAHHPPVQAYVVNIFASLLGVWFFSILSFLSTPPWVWFSFVLAGISVYYAYMKKLRISTLVVFAVTLVVVGFFGKDSLWSPYNRLDLTDFIFKRQSDGQETKIGYLLSVQQTFYQSGVNLSDEFINSIQDERDALQAKMARETADGYNLPYRLASPGSRVLIVGAGMGNDVAAALRNHMGPVDAVDIDPKILELGRDLHPEKPYQDERVQVHVDDARSFFNRTREKYDLVAFGLLDSHTLLTGFSSVRLDSFVYTIDSFAQVKKLLKENGHLVVTFAANDWIQERLGQMLSQVYGAENVWVNYWDIKVTTFVVGPVSASQASELRLSPWQSNPAIGKIPMSTDDWPYLYLRDKVLPSSTWQALILIALVCLLMIGRSFPETLKPDWHFWLLGAAFLLIEFKSITELALLFGTTWFVNSLAISGVLLMALCANLIILKTARVDLRVIYALLFASLLFSFFFPLEWLGNLPGILKGLISTALLSLPLFFSGMIFSESLRRAGETARPLASNFSGSAVGGLLEYSSLFWGIKSLYVTAGVLYLGALLAALRRRGNRR